MTSVFAARPRADTTECPRPAVAAASNDRFPHDGTGIYRLVNQIMAYDWGSTTAIPALLGCEADGTPQAEMWIGSHPAGPSLAVDGSGCRVPLDELLRSAPHALLGDLARKAGSPRLPFLLKVLAAVRPLSIQVHPDAARAERRFGEEQRAADAGLRAQRLYADPWHKPELLYALQPFEALCGFRRAAEAAALLRTLAVPALAPALGCLHAALDEPTGIRRATERLLALRGRAREVVASVVAAAARHGHPAFRTVLELARSHPDDPGVLVSLLLNRFTLRPGEALFVPPRTVHCYLRGVGVEVMAASDNVLRAGLTPKQVAVSELLAVADLAPSRPRRVEPEPTDGPEQVFAPDACDFRLSVLRVAAGELHRWRAGARTVLCLAGCATITNGRRSLMIRKGESLFLAADAGPVSVRGPGILVGALTGER